MKYFAVLPVRRDWIVDTGEIFALALVDELNLRRCLSLIDGARKLHALQAEIDELAVELARLEAKLAELEKAKVDNRNSSM